MNFPRLGLTKQICYRCKNKTQKTVYKKGGQAVVICRNCGASWVTKKF